MLFEMNNVTKVYEDRKVLDIIDLRLEKGQIIGLLGPNGAGKTTLLEMLAFLTRPTRGEIRFNGRLAWPNSSGLLEFRRKVVMVPQTPIMFTTSVYKNLEFGLKIRKFPAVERARMIEETLDLVGMRHFMHVRAHTLSGGETQRVAIARALICAPEVLLFDEPTANVDIENQHAIENIIRQINLEKGLSVILTTHSMLQAAKLVDHTVFLFDGRLAESIYENIFAGTIETDQVGRTMCHIGQLRIPIRTDIRGSVKISLNPRRLKVNGLYERTANDEILWGRILQIADEAGQIRLVVDVGVQLSLLLTSEEYGRVNARVGDQLSILCPQAAAEII